MKTVSHYTLVGISLLLITGLSACNKSDTAETAGKEIDQTVNTAGQQLSSTANKVEKKLDEQTTKAGIAIDDAAITAKIKAAFFAESGLKTLQINVITVNGVVTLSGTVDTPQNSDKVKQIASAVTGVTEVENRLVLK